MRKCVAGDRQSSVASSGEEDKGAGSGYIHPARVTVNTPLCICSFGGQSRAVCEVEVAPARRGRKTGTAVFRGPLTFGNDQLSREDVKYPRPEVLDM